MSGSSISKYWSKKNKKIIYNSRIYSTKVLSNSILKLKNPPKVFISASAVGIYGNRKSEKLTEESLINANCFLSNLCVDWEAEANKVEQTTRVVNLRLGIVLDVQNGMLKKMIPFFKLGLGSFISPTTQYISWIDLLDLYHLIKFIISSNISGPINATSPNPVTNKEFIKTLAKNLNRPCIITTPQFVLKLFLGEASLLMCEGQRVLPKKLVENGFKFKFYNLKDSLAR